MTHDDDPENRGVSPVDVPKRERSLELAAQQAKDFYSAGAAFTALGCTAAVGITWGVLGRLWDVFEPEWVALLLSAFIVYAYALLLPEPEGYDHAGTMRLTPAEVIFGFFNTLIVFATVLGVKDGFALFQVTP
ncbi:hypothetical protein OJ998_15700 [Solirubrobacter taibaiensis]|nr:hypothetical protein [Solirubrobacter taibaiensis]